MAKKDLFSPGNPYPTLPILNHFTTAVATIKIHFCSWYHCSVLYGISKLAVAFY